MRAIPPAVLSEAKREVVWLARMGRMMSPKEAWLLAGQKNAGETLWSVAFRVAGTHDESAEDVFTYLERQFPLYSHHPEAPKSWDDLHL